MMPILGSMVVTVIIVIILIIIIIIIIIIIFIIVVITIIIQIIIKIINSICKTPKQATEGRKASNYGAVASMKGGVVPKIAIVA